MNNFRAFVMVFVITAACSTTTAASTGPGNAVVQEGVGLSNLRLGESYHDVTRALGKPSEDLYGFVFVYQLPNDTELNFRVTDDKVVAVNLKGNPRTAFVTKRGARFGMTRKQVEALYGPPEAEAVHTLFYYRQGISFLFNDRGGLSELNVFPASHL